MTSDNGDPTMAEDTDRRWRVVVVDDEPDIRSLVRVLLAADPRFEVVAEAANGQEAVELVSRLLPDVVVLDLAMPVMDGLHALPLIREAGPACRVAVCSAHEESSRYVLGLGADAYIDKLHMHRQLASLLSELCMPRSA